MAESRLKLLVYSTSQAWDIGNIPGVGYPTRGISHTLIYYIIGAWDSEWGWGYG